MKIIRKLTVRIMVLTVASLLTACGGGSSGGSSPATTQSSAASSVVKIQAVDIPIDTTSFTIVDTLPTTRLQTVRTNDIAANDTLIITMEEDLRDTPDLGSELFFRLRVIDATNFVEIGHLDKVLSVVRMNFGDDGYLYIDTVGQGVVRVDVSDPGNPRIVDRVETFWGGLESLTQRNILYQAAYNHGLLAFDVTNRNKPELLDEINFDDTPQIQEINAKKKQKKGKQDLSLTPIQTQARALDIIGSTLFVATREGGLFLIDVSDPLQLTVLGHYLSQDVWDVAADNDVVYTTVTDGLEILDVKDAAAPERLAFVGLPGHSSRVTINQNVAVVAMDLTFDDEEAEEEAAEETIDEEVAEEAKEEAAEDPKTEAGEKDAEEADEEIKEEADEEANEDPGKEALEEDVRKIGKLGAIVYHDLSTPLTAENFKLIYFDDPVEEAIYKDGAIFVVTESAIYKLTSSL